jgi:2-dehydropantoate 2-reductase
MFDKNSKLLVVGAGAIGGITAGFLSRAGYNIQVVDKNPEIVNKIRSDGIHVYGQRTDFKVRPAAAANIGGLSEKKDLVFLATKATALPAVAEDIRPVLKDTSVVVSLQNGICEEIIASVVGVEATIGCVVGWGATMHNPAELEMTSTGDFIIGRIDRKEDPRLESIKDILGAVAPTQISFNIMGHLYAKLIINSCITTLGAVCGLYLGDMLSREKIRNIFIGIIREAMAVANALNLRVEPVAKLDFYSFLKGQGRMADLKRHTLIRLIGFKYRRLKSSSLQSLERGERTEIDSFNGYIALKGKVVRVETPLNEFLTSLVKQIEAGSRKITPANFDDPFFTPFN